MAKCGNLEDSYFNTWDDGVAIKSGWDCMGPSFKIPPLLAATFAVVRTSTPDGQLDRWVHYHKRDTKPTAWLTWARNKFGVPSRNITIRRVVVNMLRPPWL